MIDTFLETNYIDPEILKFTRKTTAGKLQEKKFKCGGCKEPFFYDDLKPFKYTEGSQILLCTKCHSKRNRRR